jgi:hypothetical protein
MLPALSQYLLVNQNVQADAIQPLFATIPDGVSGVRVPDALLGIAVVNCEKLGLRTSTHHIRWNAGVIQGEVTIESASEVTYTGAWTPLRTVNFQAIAQNAPREDLVIIDGNAAAYRHRITLPVAGGSVTTKMVGIA